MEVGIGLPTTIPGVTGEQVLEWARRAEARGFSTLGTIDRIVYPNYEPLIALAAVAGVTERIRLATTILIVPYRANAALVAKQAATVDHVSGGRLVLGVAGGGRGGDYAVPGGDFPTPGGGFRGVGGGGGGGRGGAARTTTPSRGWTSTPAGGASTRCSRSGSGSGRASRSPAAGPWGRRRREGARR